MLYRYPTSDYPHPQPALCADQTIQMLQSKTIASDCTRLSGLLASTDGNWILYLWTRISFFTQNTELRITDSSSNIWYKFSTVIHRHYPLLSPTRSNYHSIRSFSLSQDSWSLKWLNLWWPHFFLELALIQSYHIRSGLKIWSKKIKTAFFGHPLPDDSNSHFRKSKIFVKWLSDSH